jgi:hypothetical protein
VEDERGRYLYRLADIDLSNLDVVDIPTPIVSIGWTDVEEKGSKPCRQT